MPFQAEDVVGMLLAVALEQPPPLRDVYPEAPPELAELVKQLLAKSPADRPPSAQAVVDRLTEIEDQERKRKESRGARRPPLRPPVSEPGPIIPPLPRPGSDGPITSAVLQNAAAPDPRSDTVATGAYLAPEDIPIPPDRRQRASSRFAPLLGAWGLTVLICTVGGFVILSSLWRKTPTGSTRVFAVDHALPLSLRDQLADYPDAHELVAPPTVAELPDGSSDRDRLADDPEPGSVGRRFATRCVVIGYVLREPPSDSLLALAVRAAEGYQFVGLVRPPPSEAAKMLDRLRRLTRRDPLVPGLDIQAAWVEPRVFCDVSYEQWQANGILKDCIIRRWGE
jgi:hypothetical protein